MSDLEYDWSDDDWRNEPAERARRARRDAQRAEYKEKYEAEVKAFWETVTDHYEGTVFINGFGHSDYLKAYEDTCYRREEIRELEREMSIMMSSAAMADWKIAGWLEYGSSTLEWDWVALEIRALCARVRTFRRLIGTMVQLKRGVKEPVCAETKNTPIPAP